MCSNTGGPSNVVWLTHQSRARLTRPTSAFYGAGRVDATESA